MRPKAKSLKAHQTPQGARVAETTEGFSIKGLHFLSWTKRCPISGSKARKGGGGVENYTTNVSLQMINKTTHRQTFILFV